jgi:hypothetical protein
MAEVPGQGEVAATLAGAVALGAGFPSAVPDTPENRDLFARIKADVAAMPPGTIVDLPWEYAE